MLNPKSPVHFWFKYLLFFLAVVFCGYYISRNISEYRKFNYDLTQLVLAFFSILLMIFGRAGVFRAQIRVFSDNGSFSFLHSIRDVSVTTLLNSFLPGSLGSLYLIRQIQREIPDGFFKAANIQGFVFLLQMFLSLCLLVGGYAAIAKLDMRLLLILSGWLLLIAIGGVLSSRLAGLRFFQQRHLQVVLQTVAEGMHSNRFWPLLFWSLIELFGFILAIHFVMCSVGQGTGFLQAAYLTGLRNSSLVLAVTPAGLGTSEAIIGAGGSLIAVPTTVAVYLSLTLRLQIVILSAILAGAFNLFQAGHMKSEGGAIGSG